LGVFPRPPKIDGNPAKILNLLLSLLFNGHDLVPNKSF
jgi:hypothetical protein